MRNNERQDRDKVSGEDVSDVAQDRPTASYTPQQRRMIRKGLRVLAKVAIRSHMRRNAAQSQDSPDDGEEECR